MAQTSRLRSIAEGNLISEDAAALGGHAFSQPAGSDQPDPRQQPLPQTPSRVENAATSILLTSLRALSQRALVAIGNLFVLCTAGSAFWLWLVTMPAPNTYQLVGLALYGILILMLNWLVLRRR